MRNTYDFNYISRLKFVEEIKAKEKKLDLKAR